MPLFGETAKRAIVTLPYSENISPLKPHGNAKYSQRFSFHQRLNRNTYFCNQSLCLESLNQIIWRRRMGSGAEGHRSSTLKLRLDAAVMQICSFALAEKSECHVLNKMLLRVSFNSPEKSKVFGGRRGGGLSRSYCSRFLSAFNAAIGLKALQVEAHSCCLMCIYCAMWLIFPPLIQSQQFLLVCTLS